MQLVEMGHALDRGFRAGDGGVGRDPRRQRRRAYRTRVGDGIALLFDRVDDQRDFVVLDHVDDVRPTLGNLVTTLTGMPAALMAAAVPLVATIEKPMPTKSRATCTARGLSPPLTLRNT